MEQNKHTMTEIILMILTYRLSIKNTIQMFDTTEDDLRNALFLYPEYKEAFYHLDMETKNEDEINSKVAINKSANYWSKRNKLLREIRKAKESNNKKLEQENRELLKEHRLNIDDTMIKKLIASDKSLLTDKEKEALIKHRLKYGYSLRQMEEVFHHDRQTFKKWEVDYAKTHPIYAEKIEILNGYFNDVSKRLIYDEVNAFRKRG